MNTSEHEWNTSEHEWNTSEHEWNTSEHEWTRMEHEWIRQYTWKMTYSGSVREIVTECSHYALHA
jgi:hypothetical protein